MSGTPLTDMVHKRWALGTIGNSELWSFIREQELRAIAAEKSRDKWREVAKLFYPLVLIYADGYRRNHLLTDNHPVHQAMIDKYRALIKREKESV